MAFCAYIFKEDFDRLKRDTVRGGGGSLYGQWTSTGNPVIHVAISDNAPQNEGTADIMCSSFMLCHIGQWCTPKDSRTRQSLLSRYKGNREGHRRGNPSRFVILEVNRNDIFPYVFDNQREQGQGKLEILAGQNPFNLKDVLEKLVRSRKPQAVYQPSASAFVGPVRSPRYSPPQLQEAKTSSYQWYSSDGGNSKVQFVHSKLKGIALSGAVDMFRDTETQEMSMSFTDDRRRKRWEVKFPPCFPFDGALLIDKSTSITDRAGGYQTSYRTDFGRSDQRPGEHKEPGSDSLEKAVRSLISFIKTASTKN